MPEQYEVKRIQSYLIDAGIKGQKMTDFEFLPGSEKILKDGTRSQWKDWLANQKILSIKTKAKYTFIQLDQGTLVWHYRFTGIPHIRGFAYKERLYTIFNLPVLQSSKNYCRFRIYFENSKVLEYLDIRCLSDIKYFPHFQIHELDIFQKLAPDLTSFSPQSFTEWKKGVQPSKRDIKQELQDQFTTPSGIGNYLACEILAHAKLNPWLPLSTISSKQYAALCHGIVEVKKLCEKRTDYHWFIVFKRKNCVRCGKVVSRKKHRMSASSQTTHYCSNCQT
ncbi:MAG: DNA-formamidopyrimidine glycosylase family protein [Simkaniaceae bacterium]|nr:DNA-formamidopyrimidine glycosylase family protein [Simkaniaceae bacterium]